MSLASTFVTALAYGYRGSIFTRDAFFSTATFLAFWLLIFAPLAYTAAGPVLVADVLQFFVDATALVPVALLLGAVLGLALVKALGLGQLVDVWLTGAGGGTTLADGADDEELNLPLIVVATACAFLAVFFGAAIFASGVILYGATTISLTVAWFGVLLFGFAAVVLLVYSGVPLKYGSRFRLSSDWVSVYYALAFVALSVLQTYLVPTTHFQIWLFALLFEAALVIVLVIGYFIERGSSGTRGRFFLRSPTGVNAFLRVVFVFVVDGALVVYANYERLAASDDVSVIVFGSSFVLVLVIAIAVVAFVYLLIMLCFRVPAAELASTAPKRAEPAEDVENIVYEKVQPDVDVTESFASSIATTRRRRRPMEYTF